LIVDDEARRREGGTGCGGRWRLSNRVVEADSAEAAGKRFRAKTPDPGAAGRGVARAGRLVALEVEREQGSEVPVLMVSALDTAKRRWKPCNLARLIIW